MTARNDLLKSYVDAMQDAGWHMTADEDHAEANRRIDALTAEVRAATLTEAAATVRTDCDLRETEGQHELASYGRELADLINPTESKDRPMTNPDTVDGCDACDRLRCPDCTRHYCCETCPCGSTHSCPCECARAELARDEAE